MTTATLRAESKATVRKAIAKVRITWTDPLIDLSIEADTDDLNRVSYPVQVADLIEDTPYKWVHLNDPLVTLDGTWHPMPSTLAEARRYQVGWHGATVSGAGGDFASPYPTLTVSFTPRLVEGYRLVGDTATAQYPVDYVVKVLKAGVVLETSTVTGNTEISTGDTFDSKHNEADAMSIEVRKWSHADAIVKIAEFYSSIVKEYDGDDIFNLSILEETESSDGTLPIGNISCNEIDLSLQNLDDSLFPSNTSADLHTLVKRNRKIEPFIGFQYTNGTKEYVAKGLYWSGDWTVSDQGTDASCSARDRLELLRNIKYNGLSDPLNPNAVAEATYWQNANLKYIAEQILDYLTTVMPDLYYDIDTKLESYVIGTAFFKRQSFFEVLKQIAQAGFAYVYMDAPTDDELALNPLARDILRIKSVDRFLYKDESLLPIEITQDDYTTKAHPAKTEEVVNVAQITLRKYSIVNGKPVEDAEAATILEYENAAGIREFGRIEYEYKDNPLMQSTDLAFVAGQAIIDTFNSPLKDVSITLFGDVTLRIGDVLDIPEYQKNGVDERGYYVITKINQTWDGSLRADIAARKIGDVIEPDTAVRILEDGTIRITEASGIRVLEPNLPDTTHTWEWGDGVTTYGETSTHEYETGGAYTITHTWTPEGEEPVVSTVLVNVNPVPVSRVWDMGNGSKTGLGPITSDPYSAGTYTIAMTETDTDGATSTETKTNVLTVGA